MCQMNTYIISDSRPVTRGVPQGSLLGPLLAYFVHVINETVLATSGLFSFILYADDTLSDMIRADNANFG